MSEEVKALVELFLALSFLHFPINSVCTLVDAMLKRGKEKKSEKIVESEKNE